MKSFDDIESLRERVAELEAQIARAHEENWTPTCMDLINSFARSQGLAEVTKPENCADKIAEVIWKVDHDLRAQLDAARAAARDMLAADTGDKVKVAAIKLRAVADGAVAP